MYLGGVLRGGSLDTMGKRGISNLGHIHELYVVSNTLNRWRGELEKSSVSPSS